MTTELIPANPLPLPGFETALAKMDALETQLAPLAERARALQVTDAATFAEAGEMIAELKRITKESEIEVAPFKLIVQRVKDFIQTRLQRNTNRCTEIHASLTPKMADYSRKEREAAAKEEAAINKGREKRGEEPVAVQPSVPTVAGVRRTVNYPVTIEDPKALIKAFAKAYKASDTKRVQFLSRFIMLNEQELRAYAKDTKNPEQFNKELPGVTCKQAEAFGGKV